MPVRIPKHDPVRKERFVEGVILGMSPPEAVRHAGFKTAVHESAKILMKDPMVLDMLEEHQAHMRKRYQFDRDQAVNMLKEAYELARSTDDPKGMVAAVRELNEMHGNHAPKRIEAQIETTEGDAKKRVLAEMSVDDLLMLGGPQERKATGEIIEGVFTPVEEGEEGQASASD